MLSLPGIDMSNMKMGMFGMSAYEMNLSDYVLRVVANDWSGDGGRGFQCRGITLG